jgi:hypothetical protein
MRSSLFTRAFCGLALLLAAVLCFGQGQSGTQTSQPSSGIKTGEAISLIRSIAVGNYTVISNRPGESQYLQSTGAGSSYSQTCRSLFYLPSTIPYASDLKVVFLNCVNYNSNDYCPGPNTLKIKCSVFATANSSTFNQAFGDAPIGFFTFGGSSTGICERGKQLWGEYHGATLFAGQPYYVQSYESCALVAAPSAPTVAASGAGSNFTGGTQYFVSITYHYANGDESAASAYSAGVTPTVGQNIVVTAPAAVAGSDGYRVWLSNGNNSNTNYLAYDCNAGVIPFGTNATITFPPNGSAVGWLEGVFASGTSASIIGGGATYGGTSIGGRNNGEGLVQNQDLTFGSKPMPATNNNNVFAPNVLLALSPYGTTASAAVQGTSIDDGTGDNGYGAQAGIGSLARAIVGQTAALQYDKTIIPKQGYVQVSVGGDTAKNFASNQGLTRAQLCNLATSVFCGYGTNDLSYGAPSIISSLLTISARHTSQGKKWSYTGILPRGGTTDAYTTLANQNLSSGAQSEAARRSVNNVAADTSAGGTVTGEALFQGFASTVGPSYNVYGGGNGVANQFWFAYPCATGTEVVTNGGSACTYNASPTGQFQYSYLLPTTINGVVYNAGIQFGTAPTNGNAILATYTKIAGLKSLVGPLYTWLNSPLAIEINSSGNPQTNGGFTALSSAPVVGTIGTPQAVTATSASGFTDSTLTPTQDQYAGYCVAIIADTGTPAAVGQVQCIATNTTAGVFTCGAWTTQPSTSAKYVILKSIMQTTVHPASEGHRVIAAYLRSTFLSLFP